MRYDNEVAVFFSIYLTALICMFWLVLFFTHSYGMCHCELFYRHTGPHLLSQALTINSFSMFSKHAFFSSLFLLFFFRRQNLPGDDERSVTPNELLWQPPERSPVAMATTDADYCERARGSGYEWMEADWHNWPVCVCVSVLIILRNIQKLTSFFF